MSENAIVKQADDVLVECVARAAVACLPFVGKGDANASDLAAVNAIKDVLFSCNHLGFRVQIGEGERDEAPMLYSGETFGNVSNLGTLFDMAVDPLEGTNACKAGLPNSFSVICANQTGNIISAPDVYMNKLATAKLVSPDILDINDDPRKNITRMASFLNKPISEMVIYVLERERNESIVVAVKECGAHLELIQDGDVFAILRTHQLFGHDADLYIGIGGAPEGVLAAAFVELVGGFFQGSFVGYDDLQLSKIYSKGLNVERIYSSKDLVGVNPFFCLSFVTNGFKAGPTKILSANDHLAYSVNTFRIGSLGTNLFNESPKGLPKTSGIFENFILSQDL